MPFSFIFTVLTRMMLTSVFILLPFYLAMHNQIPFWVACIMPIFLALVLELLTIYAAIAKKKCRELTSLLKEAAKALAAAKELIDRNP